MPAATTFSRTLTRIDGDALDDALTAFTERLAADPLDDIVDSGVKSLAANGKTVRGAIDADGKQLHLLSVFRPETGTVAAQRASPNRPTSPTPGGPCSSSAPPPAGATERSTAMPNSASPALPRPPRSHCQDLWIDGYRRGLTLVSS